MTEGLIEGLRKLAEGKPAGSEGSPQFTSEGRPEDCDRTGLPKGWCSHCTGAKLPSDEDLPIPSNHDGRHGRPCRRCMAYIHAARRAVNPRGRYA